MLSKISSTVLLFLLISSYTFAQNLIVGIENGINFSNIRKSEDYNRMPAQMGPVNGLFIKYWVGDWFTFQSGTKYTTLYYSRNQNYNYNGYADLFKYNFLRIPLLAKFKTPGRLNFEIGGGAYYTLLMNDEFRGKDRDLHTKEYQNENFPPMNDWGWIIASSVNYNINNKFSLFLNGQITTGNEEYFESEKGKMGATEITFGIGYKPFAKADNFIRNDSLGQNIKIIPHTGINISRTHSNKYPNEYYNKVGLSSGVSLKFLLSPNFSFVTGAWYERKGYSLDYYGNSNFIYKTTGSAGYQNLSKIYSDTHLDYITFPVGFEISVGQRARSNFSFGSYYSLLQNVFTEGERESTYSSSNQYQVYRQFFNESQDHWVKKSDIGFFVGYRMEFPVFEWGNIFASASQSFGVKNLFNNMEVRDPGQLYYFREKMYNNSTTISVGITIPVSKN